MKARRRRRDPSGRIADELEALVDRTSLSRVLQALEEVAHEKASHLQSNWQDPASAREWTKAARVLAAAANKVMV